MSDLKSRYPNSPQLIDPQPPASADLDTEAALDVLRRQSEQHRSFYEQHPELEAMSREPVTSYNAPKVLEAVKKARVDSLKAAFGKGGHNLNEEEQTFAAEVLALRIGGSGSVRELVNNAAEDAAGDLDHAKYDAAEVRRMRARHDALKARYSKMAGFSVTPESYLSRGV